MSQKPLYYVWRDKPGKPWEQVAGPMTQAEAKNEVYERNLRASAIGSGYHYRWFPEGTDPNV